MLRAATALAAGHFYIHHSVLRCLRDRWACACPGNCRGDAILFCYGPERQMSLSYETKGEKFGALRNPGGNWDAGRWAWSTRLGIPGSIEPSR